ncbi:ExeM/NucH family extracellular endonuclease [Marinobacter nauticus]|uniref:ExeM/NucH family extracellular endonuclease n=1 Tax=Marinobacter nauticus TaxID=2743 RepID=UPI00112F9358|nr:ExeM/NucH family extracellular endonuclease [Marinobacter nauticus]TPW25022.1 ExeM/NucH family extracellular endonuclease [Marinobacter nauticus]
MTRPLQTFTALFCLGLVLSATPLQAHADNRCGASATPIHQVQGTGNQSPLIGQTVTVEGILVLDARKPGGFSGFYLQQADHQTDDNPATSEALFVYTRKAGGTVGQRVRVTGTVKEFHGLTELAPVHSLSVCGQAPLPAPINVSLPWSQPPESLENMRVRFDEPLTVIDNYNLARYGELALAASDQVIATEQLAPGPAARTLEQQNLSQRITLDDGLGKQNPTPVPWLSERDTVRAGDIVSELEGVLDYRFGQWRVQPGAVPRFQARNPRPQAPTKSTDSIRIMTLNLQNYFNGDGQGKGFPTPRGASSLEQFQTQNRKLARTIQDAHPDILAVTELENDGYGPDSAAAGLARTLGADWEVAQTPGRDGNDAIRTALLYRESRVRPTGPAYRPGPGELPGASRPPLAQAFRARGSELTFWVVVPHLKSKSCRHAAAREQDQGDGQGCYNRQRTLSANAIVIWLQALAGDPETTPVLITGDLNSYAREAPVEQFQEAGFTSLVHQYHPCLPMQCEHYTYRYQGQKGTLDYALASPALMPWVERAQTWNINADEPRALSYHQTPDQSGPWRSSDHNPVLTDLNLSPTR